MTQMSFSPEPADDGRAIVVYSTPLSLPGWELPEEDLPESVPHDAALTLLKAILAWWARDRDAFVARDLAVCWDRAHPSRGVHPDVALYLPGPPEAQDLRSVRTWIAGHRVPQLAIEVVSNANPRKDYSIVPDKYAANGVEELWVFDPLLAGPRSHGGPFRLQLWRRENDGFRRTHAGEEPFFSRVLGAHVAAVQGGRLLRIFDDEALEQPWLSGEETHAARLDRQASTISEQASTISEQASTISEQAERIAALEARLRGR